MAKIASVGSNTPKNRAMRLIVTLFIIALTVFMVSPFVWMISAAFKK
jgi:ABC-type glycerol-3-phosphate transport system permease component